MLENIKRLECLAGFLGTHQKGGTLKTIIVVLDEAKIAKNYYHAIEEEVKKYNSYNNEIVELNSRFSSASQPLIFHPEKLTQLDDVEKTGIIDHKIISLLELNGTAPIMVICPDKTSYAYVSERLGTGRREQIQLAESPINSKKPLGDAHKIIDKIKNKKGIVYVSVPDPVGDKKMYDHFDKMSDLISKAKKFQCGYVPPDAKYSIPVEDALQNMMLPYETCFFELETDFATAEDPNNPKKGKAFIVATTQNIDGKTIYTAYQMLTKGNNLDFGDAFSYWYYDEDNQLNASPHPITGTYYSEEMSQKNTQALLSSLFYILPTINRMTTRLMAHEPTTKRLQYGSKPMAPYFTYYSFVESPIERGNLLQLGYDRDRFVAGSERKPPSAHERIGHWRKFESDFYKNAKGKDRWINPTLVGEAKDGAKGRSLILK